jgi:hypothetical protein
MYYISRSVLAVLRHGKRKEKPKYIYDITGNEGEMWQIAVVQDQAVNLRKKEERKWNGGGFNQSFQDLFKCTNMVKHRVK